MVLCGAIENSEIKLPLNGVIERFDTMSCDVIREEI